MNNNIFNPAIIPMPLDIGPNSPPSGTIGEQSLPGGGYVKFNADGEPTAIFDEHGNPIFGDPTT